jgi:hypothetical protein
MTDVTTPAGAPRPICDGNRILFDIFDGDELVACAISRAALEDISETRCFKPAQMLASFAASREKIEAVALAKRQARPGPLEGRLNIWADDMEILSEEDEAPQAPPADLRQSA